MGFWIFMLVCCLLVPVTMVVFGGIWRKRPPKNINAVFGYRTARSMKTQETWDFAHKTGGKLWWVAGWILLGVSLGALLPFFGKSEGMVGLAGGIVELLQIVVLAVSIIPVEKALKREFDQQGFRKSSVSQ